MIFFSIDEETGQYGFDYCLFADGIQNNIRWKKHTHIHGNGYWRGWLNRHQNSSALCIAPAIKRFASSLVLFCLFMIHRSSGVLDVLFGLVQTNFYPSKFLMLNFLLRSAVRLSGAIWIGEHLYIIDISFDTALLHLRNKQNNSNFYWGQSKLGLNISL